VRGTWFRSKKNRKQRGGGLSLVEIKDCFRYPPKKKRKIYRLIEKIDKFFNLKTSNRDLSFKSVAKFFFDHFQLNLVKFGFALKNITKPKFLFL
jgi:hypothetical protein